MEMKTTFRYVYECERRKGILDSYNESNNVEKRVDCLEKLLNNRGKNANLTAKLVFANQFILKNIDQLKQLKLFKNI